MMKKVLPILTMIWACGAWAEGLPKPFIHWTFDDANAVTNCGMGGAEYTPAIDGGAISYTNGVIGGALYIDKTKSNRIATGYTLKDTGTICFWFRPESLYSYNSVFNNKSHPNKWECWLQDDGHFLARLNDVKQSLWITNYNSSNAWYHVAYTYERYTDAEGNELANSYFYLNGVKRAQSEAESCFVPGELLIGGGDGNNYGDFFVDDVRIYETMLTHAHIRELFNDGARRQPAVHITFDENVENIGLDGSRFAATLSGSGIYWTNGILPNTKAFYLDKTANLAAIPYRISTGHSGSVSLWFNAYDAPYNWNTIFDNSKGGNDFELFIRDGGSMGFTTTGSKAYMRMDGVTQFYNMPRHLVVTWDYAIASSPCVLKFYLDGVLIKEMLDGVNNTLDAFGSDYFYIGGGTNAKGYGWVSDLQIFNAAISHEQVKDIYADCISRMHADKASLLAHLPLDNSIRDVVGSHETVVGGELTFVKDEGREALRSALNFTGSNNVKIENLFTEKSVKTGTLAMWVKISPFDTSTMNVFDNACNPQYWECWVNGTKVHMRINNSRNSSVVSKNLSLDTWYHLAFTWDKDLEKIQMYVDGIPTSSDWLPASEWIEPDAAFYLGSSSGNTKFKGVIDDFRFYDGVLMPEEIAKLAEIPEFEYRGTVIIMR